ncbi:MAG: hypothetical protein QF371_02390 [Flavobacteriales bacterium]|jgi:hypothetical protein|nr:hypothetical protein [Flavobacteriales bacterium]
MRISKISLIAIAFLCSVILFSGCEKETIYDVNEETILAPNAGKTKLKSDQQYIAILYANLFQTALSSDNLFEASECVQSIGDKDLVHEVLISNYMNEGGVILPSNQEMRADIDLFITETYHRFLVRNPTEAERQYFKNYINTNPNVTSELVYFSFALSNEYQYY